MRRLGFDYLIYAVCGALLALPFTFPKFWIIAWLAPVPMLFIEAKRDRTMRHPRSIQTRTRIFLPVRDHDILLVLRAVSS